MPAKIPWEIIGPAAGVVIILLWIIFKFMLKWQKQAKDKTIQFAPAPPKNVNSMDKKSPCFRHEGDIAANTTAIGMIGKQLVITNENNRKDHKDMFTKLEDLTTKIITEIHKANGD